MGNPISVKPEPWFILGFLVLLLLSGTGTKALADPSDLLCTYNPKTERWTVRAQQVSLQVLFSTLAARAGFELVGSLPPGPKITLQFRQAPLGEILKSILKQGQCSYGLLYRGDRLQRLMLFVSSPQGRSLASYPEPAAAETPQALQPSPPPEELLRMRHRREPSDHRGGFQAPAPLSEEEPAQQEGQEDLLDPDSQVPARVMPPPGHFPPGHPRARHSLRRPPNPYPEQIPEGEEE
jgi:hypothetical protein